MPKFTKGEKMPSFDVTLAFEGKKNSDDLLKKAKHTIFWVLRYMGCTTCQLDILEIADSYEAFKALDTQVLVVLQSPAETVEEQTKDARLPYDVICDADQTIYKTLQIEATQTKEQRQPKDEAGKARLALKKEKVKARGLVHGKYEGNEQQLPAFFVVSPDGTIEYAHYAAHSADMPFSEDALEIIKSL